MDLGAYQYFLTKEGNNWVLANSQSAVTPPTTPDESKTPTNPSVQPERPSIPTMPVAPIIPIQPNNPTLPQTALLSNKANAQVSLRQAQLLLVENELSGIHQRLGEVKNGEKGNVWVRNVNSREKLTALSTGDSQTSGFKQSVHSLQVGADATVNDNFRLGGFVGRSQANVDFNGHYGDGKVHSNSVGLYATYLANNGIYVDNIVKYSRLKAQSDHTEKHRYHAYTLSSELGKQFKLSDDWIITPQAQLGWTHIQGKKNEDSLSSVYSRVGLRVAKSFTLANGWNLQPYAEINAITSRNNNSKIHYANAALNVEDSRGRFESVLGVNAGATNHRLGLEVSRADGKRYDKPYQIQAVYRYQW
ncbi:pertactin [Rodentibacter pneumotropicus]|nr:pertactin [Rodentibacter pneumotropicus]